MRAIRNEHEACDRVVLIRHPFDQSVDISRAVFCAPTDQNALLGFGLRWAHDFFHNAVHADLAAREDLARRCLCLPLKQYCGSAVCGKGAA